MRAAVQAAGSPSTDESASHSTLSLAIRRGHGKESQVKKNIPSPVARRTSDGSSDLQTDTRNITRYFASVSQNCQLSDEEMWNELSEKVRTL